MEIPLSVSLERHGKCVVVGESAVYSDRLVICGLDSSRASHLIGGGLSAIWWHCWDKVCMLRVCKDLEVT